MSYVFIADVILLYNVSHITLKLSLLHGHTKNLQYVFQNVVTY